MFDQKNNILNNMVNADGSVSFLIKNASLNEIHAPSFADALDKLLKIKFFEKVPKPLISTLLSRATASVIVSKIASTAFDTSVLDKSLNSLLIDDSISDRVNVSFLILFTQF